MKAHELPNLSGMIEKHWDKLVSLYPEIEEPRIKQVIDRIEDPSDIYCKGIGIMENAKDLKRRNIYCISHDDLFQYSIPSYIQLGEINMPWCGIDSFEMSVVWALQKTIAQNTGNRRS